MNGESSFTALLSTLGSEIVEYRKLFELLEKEFEYVTDVDRKALSLNNSRKEALLRRLARLNEKRVFLISQVTESSDIEGPITLKKLVNIAPENLKEPYSRCHEEFLELVERVRRKNIYNKEYLALSIRRLRAISKNLFKYMDGDQTYNGKGRVPDSRRTSFMVKEA